MSAKKPQETDNLQVWNKLQETDPNYTKGFDRGGYKGTSINPTYCYKKLTETFGPAGIGWYFEVVKSEVVDCPGSKELMIFKEVHLFVKHEGEWSKPIIGNGGDFIIASYKQGSYIKADDEAHKKSVTDALTNAMKMLGMSADVHMGEYDDSKYLNNLKEKYKDEPAAKKAGQPKAASQDEINMVLEAVKEAKTEREFLEVKTTKLGALWNRLTDADQKKLTEAFVKRAAELGIKPKEKPSAKANGLQQKLDRADSAMATA